MSLFFESSLYKIYVFYLLSFITDSKYSLNSVDQLKCSQNIPTSVRIDEGVPMVELYFAPRGEAYKQNNII